MPSDSSHTVLRFVVDEAGERVDRFLAQRAAISRTQVQHLIQQGDVLVNGVPSKASYKLEASDSIEARLSPPAPVTLEPQDIPLRVVYQDDDLLVVDKPAGLTVHPAPGHPDRTLVNAVLALCPELQDAEGSLRPGIVHRLDKDTSGLMVVAKHAAAQASLSKQLEERTVTKHYLALVEGRLTPERGLIEAPIGRDRAHRQRMAVVSRGRASRTGYQVVEYLSNQTLLRITPETGRTHQIRVHLAAIGHPVVGDRVYGKVSPLCPRQFLHAQVLGFRHPRTGEYVEFRSDLPEDLVEALEAFRGVLTV